MNYEKDIMLNVLLVLIFLSWWWICKWKYILKWRCKIQSKATQLPFQMVILTVYKFSEICRFCLWLIWVCDHFYLQILNLKVSNWKVFWNIKTNIKICTCCILNRIFIYLFTYIYMYMYNIWVMYWCGESFCTCAVFIG